MNIAARIKKNKLDDLASIHYRDASSEFIKDLNSRGRMALIGIEKEDGVYTALGVEQIYYCSEHGDEGQISHFQFLDALKKNALNSGKTKAFEFVEVEHGVKVWVMNGETMTALWNTVLYLSRSR